MPQWLHKYNSWYTEPAPKQQWTLRPTHNPSREGGASSGLKEDDNAQQSSEARLSPSRESGEWVLGYRSQRATCHFRGRDFEAWFAPSIPGKRGPWKFQGLPGLILKVYDKERLYTFEAIGLETRRYPITRFKQYKDYTRSTREKVWKMQRKFNENWFKAVDFHKATVDASGNMIPGEAVSIFTPYNPLELE
ncbi:MAG: GLPGLI family protein [Bacteroidaceae bacterium]|nr:GLPGLI family protein [Bacteroidaceae bacterium]